MIRKNLLTETGKNNRELSDKAVTVPNVKPDISTRDLAEEIAVRKNEDPDKIQQLLKLAFRQIGEALLQGYSVDYPGLGTFWVQVKNLGRGKDVKIMLTPDPSFTEHLLAASGRSSNETVNLEFSPTKELRDKLIKAFGDDKQKGKPK